MLVFQHCLNPTWRVSPSEIVFTARRPNCHLLEKFKSFAKKNMQQGQQILFFLCHITNYKLPKCAPQLLYSFPPRKADCQRKHQIQHFHVQTPLETEVANETADALYLWFIYGEVYDRRFSDCSLDINPPGGNLTARIANFSVCSLIAF